VDEESWIAARLAEAPELTAEQIATLRRLLAESQPDNALLPEGRQKDRLMQREA
jgi:hypothetical protein